MNLLAIDTCTEVCSISLYTNGVKTNRCLQGVAKSSAYVLSLCDEVFSELKFKAADLDAIIYTRGPGAFTGVRMCVAIVQGLSLAHNIPTKGYSTLALMGFSAAKKYPARPIAVALDARMNEVYWGVYTDGQLRDESLQNPNRLSRLAGDCMGVGSGWSVFADTLRAQTGVHNFKADFYPKAHDLIDLYRSQPQSDFDNQLPLPTYLRNNVAQKSS